VDPQIDATAPAEDDADEAGNGGVAEAHGGTTPPRRPTGKLGAALQAICADTGATLTELTSLTNWLPHTTRAAVTGLRQRGFPIALIQEDGRSRGRPGHPAARVGPRCAIYTRKSSEEGLEQEFNSLDAQREACEAYIRSQRHEGWALTARPLR
jgi:hypothetical protein